jgi:serine/threonine-protein kinase
LNISSQNPLTTFAISPEVWEQICDVFYDASHLDAADREAFIQTRCGGALFVAGEVRRLLVETQDIGEFLESPAIESPFRNAPGEYQNQIFQLGDLVGERFRIARLLGSGGMGEVYEARDEDLGQDVAIKTLNSSVAKDERMAVRFRSEVLRSRRITHPHVARVHDFFVHREPQKPDIIFFTMELLHGQTLSEHLRAHGPFTPSEALRLLRQIAAAVHAAHVERIIHRDLKPSNIFLCGDSEGGQRAVVTDFGIAAEAGITTDGDAGSPNGPALTLAGGTPAYMAPEQMAAEPVSTATDVYALALIALEMVTATPVFDSPSPLACMIQKLSADTESVLAGYKSIPECWRAPIERCLMRNPQDRLSTPENLVQALDRCDGVNEFRDDSRRKRWWWGGALAGGTLAAGLLWTIYHPFDPQVRQSSLAVLPFDNLTGDSRRNYLADGIAEEVSQSLAVYPNLRIAAPVAITKLHSEGVPPLIMARRLNVQTVLTGAVGKRGNSETVSLRLLQATNGATLWTKEYDISHGQTLTAQLETVREIATLLSGTKPHVAHERRPGSSSPEAYDLYLRGRHLWNDRTREGMEQALPYFEQAIRLDGTFDLAYSAITDTYDTLADYAVLPAADVAPRARSAITRALSINPDSAEVQSSLGLFDNMIEWDQKGAEKAFQRALTLSPSLLSAHMWYANYLMRGRRLDEALREAESARRLDPVSLPTLVFEGWVRYYRHEFKEAMAIGQSAVDLNPSYPHGHQLLALSAAAAGDKKRALAESAVAVKLTSDESVALRYRALALSLIPDLAEEGRRVARQMEVKTGSRQAGYLAIVYAGLNEREKMLAWAKRALDEHDIALLMANVAPQLDRFRTDHSFQDIIHHTGY